LLQSADGNFGTTYSYRCDNGQPIDRCLAEDFFDTVKTRLGPGDVIRVCEYKDSKVTASCELIVVSRGPQPAMKLDIRLYKGQEIYRYEDGSVEEEEKPETKEPDEIYIDGTGTVERDEVSKIYKVKCDGNVIYETEKKGLAMAIARGDAPVPQG
jgi:hypothetical protein